MTDPTSREDLSALMDGELAAEPTRFLLRRLDHDPELAATWSRWHMVRACLAADPARLTGARSDDAFAARVANALQSEAVPQVRSRGWARYVGGGAIAASVAVAALMLNSPNPAPERATALAQQSQPAAATQPTFANATPTRAPAPWLMARQPTVLGAQPASANIIYGTGLMQPDYLRRATFAHDVTMAYSPTLPGGESAAPMTVLVVPAAPHSSGAAVAH